MPKIIKFTLLISAGIVLLWMAVLINQAIRAKSTTKLYTVDSIYVSKDGVKDIVFVTNEDRSLVLYANRGLELYSLEYFQKLLNKKVFFTFDLFNATSMGRITRIEFEGKEFYNYAYRSK